MDCYKLIDLIFKGLNLLGLFALVIIGFYVWKRRFLIEKQNHLAKELLETVFDYKTELYLLTLPYMALPYIEDEKVTPVIKSFITKEMTFETIKSTYKILDELLKDRWKEIDKIDSKLDRLVIEARIVFGIDLGNFIETFSKAALDLFIAFLHMKDYFDSRESGTKPIQSDKEKLTQSFEILIPQSEENQFVRKEIKDSLEKVSNLVAPFLSLDRKMNKHHNKTKENN